MKYKALIWFTGVISRYSLINNNISETTLNIATLNSLKEKYEPLFIICIKNNEEKQQYNELLKSNNLLDIPVLYVPYNFIFEDALQQLVEQDPSITYYVDYSKVRLQKAAQYINNNNCIHISQLLN